MWYQRKKKFLEGIQKCLNLQDQKFEQIINEIYEVFKTNEDNLSTLTEIEIEGISSTEDRILVLKTIFYIIQRFNLFILSPLKLQNDLNELGFTPEKSQILIKFYSEVSREIIKDLDMSASTTAEEEVLYEIKSTLSDAASQKCKIPKAKITLKSQNQVMTFDDLNHSELSKLFDKLEVIQTELDNLSK